VIHEFDRQIAVQRQDERTWTADLSDGWVVGGGVDWQSERAYFSGVTHGSGQVQTDTDGEVIVLYMPDRYVFNGFVRKEWKSGRYNQFVQLNVDNLLNDTDLYGQIYAQGITARLSYQIGF